MRLLADLHTHTVASGHAFSTLTENAQVARERGLELIAITDHGPTVPQGAHPWYFWNLKVVPSVLDDVRILKGCEANLSADSENGIDLPDQILGWLDFVAVGFHPHTGFDTRDRVRNTEALVRVMAHPFVDQITHPGNDAEFPLDLDSIVEAAVRHNVILELNDHSFDPTSSRAGSGEREREFAEAALAAGAPLSIGSDAHYALYVGRFEAAIAVAEKIGLTEECVVNRTAESVLAHLLGKRERPRLDVGGEWEWPAPMHGVAPVGREGAGKGERPEGGRWVVVERVLKSRRVRDYALMSVGLVMTAWALDVFLIPNKIAAGGVSGLSTVIHDWAQAKFGVSIPVGVMMLVMNGILLVIAWRVRGLGYMAKTIFGAVALSVLVDVMAPHVPHLAGDDLLLAALYGGAITGIGMGFVFKAGGNTGGTDIVAQLLSRRFPFGVGQIMLIVDAGVTTLAAIEFGARLAMYGVVAIFVSTAAIDLVLEGISVEKAVWIISDAADRIGESINAELGRGATRIEATGVYTGEKRGTLMVVLARNELDDLKAIVAAIDPRALVIISNVHEAIGEGFKEMGR